MDLIRRNATKPSYCKWTTLTYADDLALYFKAYLSDLKYKGDEKEDVCNSSAAVVKNVEGKDKKFIKSESLK